MSWVPGWESKCTRKQHTGVLEDFWRGGKPDSGEDGRQEGRRATERAQGRGLDGRLIGAEGRALCQMNLEQKPENSNICKGPVALGQEPA